MVGVFRLWTELTADMVDEELEKDHPEKKAEDWAENFVWDSRWHHWVDLNSWETFMGPVVDDLGAMVEQMPTSFDYRTRVMSEVENNTEYSPLPDNHELEENAMRWKKHHAQGFKCCKVDFCKRTEEYLSRFAVESQD
jgi:hypothetical protein